MPETGTVLRDLVRCPLADTNDCGAQGSYMVFPDGHRWLCDEFECPVMDGRIGAEDD